MNFKHNFKKFTFGPILTIPWMLTFFLKASSIFLQHSFDTIPIKQFDFTGQCSTPRPTADQGVMSIDRYCGLTLK